MIATIERNPVTKGSLAEKELKEFNKEIDDYFPVNARNWLKQYFKRVKTIYVYKILTGTIEDDGWDLLGELRILLHQQLGGISQADNEGFSNEESYHILWQFFEGVSSKWDMATLNEKGKWVTYQIELSDKRAVESFKKGIPPKI